MHRNHKRGSALVEFCLSAPLMFLMLGAVADASRAMYAATAVVNAARAGMLYGYQGTSHQTDYTGMQTTATNSAPYISGMTATATRYCEDSSGTSVSCGSSPTRIYLDVTTNATFTLLCSYLFLPTSMNLSARNRMRIQ